MKTTLTMLAILLTLTGCTGGNKYGKCIGLNSDKEPNLKYEYSVRNIALAIIFFEMVVPPVRVLLKAHSCPVEMENK